MRTACVRRESATARIQLLGSRKLKFLKYKIWFQTPGLALSPPLGNSLHDLQCKLYTVKVQETGQL